MFHNHRGDPERTSARAPRRRGGPLAAHAATRWLGLAALLCALAAATPARAQSTTAAGAESLFNEGRQLMEAGDYAAACDKFEASHELEPSIGALLNLGDCREKNRQIASAWVAYRLAATLAGRDGDQRRRRFAQRRAETLEPRLSYVIIQVADDSRVPGLAVRLDGEDIGEPLWGQRLPANIGAHTLEVSAANHLPETVTVTVPDERSVVEVEAPKLDEIPMVTPGSSTPAELRSRAGDGAGPGDPSAAAGPTSPPTADPSDSSGGLSGGRIAAIGAGAIGLAGIATGVLFAQRSQDKWDKAQSGGHCNEFNQCDPEGLALAKEASDAATVSNVSYAAGAIFVVGGVALWLLSPSSSDDDRLARGAAAPAPTVTLIPILSPERAGLAVQRSF